MPLICFLSIFIFGIKKNLLRFPVILVEIKNREKKFSMWCRSYALSPVCEVATRPIEETPLVNTTKADFAEIDSKEVILPGVNLIFDGSELHPFDIGACLQARQPISLIAEAAAASASGAIK